VRFALKLRDFVLIGIAAVRANPTVCPNAGLKPIAGGGFIEEDRVFEKIGHGVLGRFRTLDLNQWSCLVLAYFDRQWPNLKIPVV
jgi:hypothetical protein